MCQPIRDAAEAGADAGTPQFMKPGRRWATSCSNWPTRMRRRAGDFSASNKLERASLYLFVAERMQGHGQPGRAETYAKARATFDRSTQLGKLNRERVEIPLENGHDARTFHPRAGRRAANPLWSIATASIAARSCSTGRGCQKRWRVAASPPCASISRARARRCGCRACRSIRIQRSWASKGGRLAGAAKRC